MKLLIVELPFDGVSPGLPDDLYQQAIKLLDQETRAKISRLYKKEDAWRSLTGQLMLRYQLCRLGHDPSKFVIERTDTGKPFLKDLEIAFNISHDSSLVVLAFEEKPDGVEVGVDVMRGELPSGLTFEGFLDVLDEQLSSTEKAYLRRLDVEGPKHAYWIWTMKEAYTKALGLGLGFDFKRISFDLRDNQLSVDQRLVTGWGLWMLELSDGYQCCIARSGTGDETNKVQKTLTDVEYIDIYEIVNSLSR